MTSELVDKITQHISEQGRFTFADFMEMALYYPGLGYYTSSRQRVGAGGDFFTSPTTHPAFAALISLQLEQMWGGLGRPSVFTVIEMGGGKGLLARDVLAYVPHLDPAFGESLAYVVMEKGDTPVARESPGFPGEPATRISDGITGCILSNELIDAMPVHRVRMENGRLQELYVTVREDHFVEIPGPPSTPLLEEQLAREGISLPDGYCAEVNLNISGWMDTVAKMLARGFVLTVDYGYPASELYSPARRLGSVMTYYRHTCGDDPFKRVGEQDITCHVDFTAIEVAGEERGLRTEGLISQREFLLNLGLHQMNEALARQGLDYATYAANRLAMLELVKEEGLGRFKVLIQSKAATGARLCGLAGERPDTLLSGKRLAVPLLHSEHVPLLEGKYPHLSSNPWDLPMDE